VEFLATERPPLSAACIGVAGAVIAGRSKLTNLPGCSMKPTSRAPRRSRVKLLNDEAAAYGMLHLPAGGYAVLNSPAESDAETSR
jgi:glucokinase